MLKDDRKEQWKMKLKGKVILLLAIILGLNSVMPTMTKASTDNTIQNAIFISENGTYSGTTTENSEAYYSFSLQKSGIVTLTLEAYEDDGVGIVLYDNEYKKINDYWAYYDRNRHCAYKKVNYDLCAGTYYIKLNYLDKNTAYSFKLNYQKVDETFPESQNSRNDILAQAKAISLNQKIYGMIGDEENQDFYIFDMPFSGKLTITHYNYTEGQRGDYEVLDSEGNKVYTCYAHYDDNKGYAYAKDTTELDKGTYYIKVYDDAGPYKFWINIKPDTAAIDSGLRSKSKATIKLKKISGVTGYVLQYSTSDKFSKKSTKSKTIKGTTVKLSGLNKKKTYYVRVRCYKTLNGKTYYGDYGNTYTLWP